MPDVGAFATWVQSTGASAWVRAESPWLWPFCETLHFMALAVLVGVAGFFDVRLMGGLRSVPLSAISRFKPWAAGAFLVNLATGVVFFTGSAGQYVVNPIWWAKLFFIVLAGANAVLFETMLGSQARTIGPNDDTPWSFKLVGATSLVAWFAVLYCGRMLPFIGGTD
jgi:hypothetical protein